MANVKRPMFEAHILEGLCRTIGDTTDGLTGAEIGQVLLNSNIPDIQHLLIGKISINAQIIY